jgi:hypothetical protein
MECHVEHPCEACLQEQIERARKGSDAILRQMEITSRINRRVEESIAEMPWWKRKMRRL